MVNEFLSFLREYKITSLVVAVVMGTASTSMINSLVKDVFMPMVSPLLFAGSWRDAVVVVGHARIGYGSFLAEFLNFIILAFIIFIVAKKILRRGEKKKK